MTNVFTLIVALLIAIPTVIYVVMPFLALTRNKLEEK
jgi:hypothetical protein